MKKNDMQLVTQMLEMKAALVKCQEREKQLCRFLWKAELDQAREAKKYDFMYDDTLENARVYTENIRDIFGFMPCPEAVAIFKKYQEISHEDDKDE